MVEALAWPMVVLIALLVLRGPLREIVQRLALLINRLTKVRHNGTELEFEQDVQAIQGALKSAAPALQASAVGNGEDEEAFLRED